MTGADLAEFMVKRRINVSKMAKLLGVSRARVERMRRNEVPIPSCIGYACAALAWGLPPWESGVEPRKPLEIVENDGALIIGE